MVVALTAIPAGIYGGRSQSPEYDTVAYVWTPWAGKDVFSGPCAFPML